MVWSLSPQHRKTVVGAVPVLTTSPFSQAASPSTPVAPPSLLTSGRSVATLPQALNAPFDAWFSQQAQTQFDERGAVDTRSSSRPPSYS